MGNELLQISADEQRRAARTAALFSEEELTRFLQVMLKTFDELGYRQEQRFHFELGLLKLVHLRRLLPIEEALSQIDTGSAARTGGAGTAARTTAPARLTPTPHPAAAPARPAFSPFEQDRNRRRPEMSAPIGVSPAAAHTIETRGATAVSLAPAARPALEALPMPVPAPVQQPDPMPFSMPSRLEERIEQQPDVPLPSPVFETVAPALSQIPPSAPHAVVGPASDPQQAAVEALAAAKHSSAADAMADATWTIANSEALVQTELSPTMLPVVMNTEAEKIVRAVLRDASIPKLTLLPGAAAPAAAKKVRPARSGSVQAKALEHPMVQQAQKLFGAEIQTVIDLREPD
jgi:DNA polymerase-3 subunit gamma/tau